jgi:hypothetical protein
MQRITFILAAALLFSTFTSCRKVNGEGRVISETRTISGFNGVAISMAADVVFKQGPDYKVELEAQQNILDVIESRVVGGELRIGVKNNVRLRSYERVVIRISSPDIYSLSMSGSGRIDAVAPITTSRMRLALSGSGNINIDTLKCSGDIESVISGSGNILVRDGNCHKEDLFISGSGKLYIDGVVANGVEANISGSGDIKVHALNTLDAKISGSGSIYYKGNPVVNVNTSGSGKVIRL